MGCCIIGENKELARIRYLKPDFFKDEDLATLSYETRLFFAGLWNFADKEGRLEDRPKRLKVEIFPYDKVDVDKCLELLSNPKNSSGKPFIQRFKVGDMGFIQIVNWHKHQKPHNTETESKIPPAPPLMEKIKEKGMEKQVEQSMELRNGEGTVKQPLLFPFEEIWLKYPKRIGKKQAERHFFASVKVEQNWLDIQTALKNYLESERVAKGFIQNGATWFGNWKDWVLFKEPICPICKNKGIYISNTGYECKCSCPVGVSK